MISIYTDFLFYSEKYLIFENFDKQYIKIIHK